ncbi:hypothetical protein [uncultured Paludibaculum sp.]|uniref:hypothetical protein n=1 Tax=uncultured Paludibaculum sp. TaxID=1765020 RepID=UPI002AAC24AD|nr:hypothetical protein [uncultured Paludibaculum sp.]
MSLAHPIRYKNLNSALLTLALAVLFCGAAHSSAVQSATPGAIDGAPAKVFVYRYKQYVGKGIRPSLICDDTDVARIQSGRMVVLALSPGKHRMRSNDAQSQIELDVKPGTDYYLRVEIAAGFMKGHGRLVLVMPEQGAAEIKQMKPADKDMVKAPELLAPEFKPAL